MSLKQPSDLALQRCLLQQKLREQRQYIIEHLCVSADTPPHFPRSAAMRFLSGRAGFKVLTEIAVRYVGARYPGATANVFTLMRLFSVK